MWVAIYLVFIRGNTWVTSNSDNRNSIFFLLIYQFFHRHYFVYGKKYPSSRIENQKSHPLSIAHWSTCRCPFSAASLHVFFDGFICFILAEATIFRSVMSVISKSTCSNTSKNDMSHTTYSLLLDILLSHKYLVHME
jgi:hypothetical protein